MKFSGALNKMSTIYRTPVKYALNIGDDVLIANHLINKELNISFTHQCICSCGKIVPELYRGGFCRECFFNNPAAVDAFFRPELSQAHLGIADRDLEFEKRYQLQPHVVYLANSSGLKVGVTRANNKVHRWMDQGASAAIVLAETPNRFEAGRIEVALKEFTADKTNWRKMLQNDVPDVNLEMEKARLSEKLDDELKAFISADPEIYMFYYPVENYPAKVKSVNLSKTDHFTGKLNGIKGQYFLFEDGHVMNVRSHEGFIVDLEVAN